MPDDQFEEAFRAAAEEALARTFGAGGVDAHQEPTGRSEGEAATAEADTEVAVETLDQGAWREYVDRMIESGNQVMMNPYGEPIIEVIAPRSMRGDVEDLIDQWDLNPSGHGVLAQEPSFAENNPEIAKGLVAWQFLLAEGEEGDVRSCGYDLGSIIDALEGEPILYSKARRVQATLPCE